MSNRCQLLWAAAPAFTLALTAAVLAAPPLATDTASARLATYDKAAGPTHFALSLTPPAQGAVTNHDVVVLIDTSASQTGAYRDDSLAALRTMLGSLGVNDRVKLIAVDIDAVPLTASFVASDGPEMKAALEKLANRTPLGSTDLSKALTAASESYAGNGNTTGRAVIYIGDGMSKSQVLGSAKFARQMQDLVKARVSVTTYAIGPERDLHVLATLANQTGGNLYVDTDTQPTAQEFGLMLAKSVATPVFYPVEAKLPAEMSDVLPQIVPPLRSDRDAILIGKLSARSEMSVGMKAEVGGKVVDLSWRVAPEKSNIDFAFLPELADTADKDGGATLPTVGSAGLREAGRAMIASAENLTKIGKTALAAGDKAGAKTAAELALARDPENPQALAVRQVAVQEEVPPAVAPAPAPAPTTPAPTTPAPLARGGEPDLNLGPRDGGEGSLIDAFEREQGGLLLTEQERRKLENERMRAYVDNELLNARKSIYANPEGTMDQLKLVLDEVERTTVLDPEVRSSLRNKLEAVIRESRRLSVEVADQRATQEERIAAAQTNLRLVEEIYRKEDRISQLMAKFEALMEEERYRDAEEEVAMVARAIKDTPTARSAVLNARIARSIARMVEAFEKRQRGFYDALALVEEAHIPFPDEPPVVYPDAEVWQRITRDRKKYASVDLATPGSSEQRIFDALEKPVTGGFSFSEVPLADFVSRLKQEYDDLPIVIDTAALAAANIPTDTLITKDLKGVSLRSALRLTLKDHALSYVVKDEVLQITTKEEADLTLKTKVYPVADLVLPITSGTQVNPFQLGGGFGGGGGGGGFGGGGFGGQQGGFGGGFGGQQGGFGGGGGIFVVEDDLSLGNKAAAKPAKAVKAVTPAPAAVTIEKPQLAKPKTASTVEPIQLTIPAGSTAQAAWDAYFAKNAKVPADVLRETVRQLMRAKKYDETANMIYAALKSSNTQPWMYEALSLALQAKGADKAELERAMMSAVDFAKTPEDAMLVALHMMRLKLDTRALQIFRDVSSLDPRRPEPYVQGLKLAKRLNDLEAIEWACVGVLRQAWPKEQSAIEGEARLAAQDTLLRLTKENKTAEAQKFAAEVNKALARDCYVKVSWTGDADVDLLIQEPAGTVVSFRSPRSTSGGVLLGESLARASTAESNSETYVCPEGFSGRYNMLVKRVWGKVTAGKVTVDIYTNYKTPQQRHFRQQIALSDKDALVEIDLAQGRRQEPLAEQQVANVAKVQRAIGRAVLAQQLEYASQSNATRNYVASMVDAQRDNRLIVPLRRGAVGYRPMITTLPEGASMTATAVISADRRYVRITPTPIFSQIGEVNTFNFATGAGGTTGGGATGGGGIGGGGIGGVF